MDFYVFSDKERARIYYRDGKASAIIATCYVYKAERTSGYLSAASGG